MFEFFLICDFSSAVTALWDQDGGFVCDIYGDKTKEWSWKTHHIKRIEIQVGFSNESSLLIAGKEGSWRFTVAAQS